MNTLTITEKLVILGAMTGAAIIIGLLTSCSSRVNTPIIGHSYDAARANKPYRYEGESLEDCDIMTPEERERGSFGGQSDGCVDYEQINQVDGRK